MGGELIVATGAEELAMRACDFIAGKITASTGVFRFALSGGSTPRLLFTLLGERGDLPWDRIELFWGDERFVPHDSPDSNFRMARETLLAHGATPKAVHPIPTGGTPDDAAARYEALLKREYGAPMLVRERSLFDLMLLGLGDDGHTASLLPGQPVLEVRDAWVAAVPKGREKPRITLTYPTLESSRVTMFLVAGTGKADALRRARAGDRSLPAGRLRPQGELMWFADRAAAAS